MVVVAVVVAVVVGEVVVVAGTASDHYLVDTGQVQIVDNLRDKDHLQLQEHPSLEVFVTYD